MEKMNASTMAMLQTANRRSFMEYCFPFICAELQYTCSHKGLVIPADAEGVVEGFHGKSTDDLESFMCADLKSQGFQVYHLYILWRDDGGLEIKYRITTNPPTYRAKPKPSWLFCCSVKK